MLEIRGRQVRSGDGLTRRGFLKIGSLGIGGLTLPGILRLRQAQAASSRKDTAVILYWMSGGPSQIDMWDMKPNAPAEVRGPFRAVPTRVAGLALNELLPGHASVADKLAIVRSLHHHNYDHFDAAHWMQTGYHVPKLMGRGQPYPAQGAVVSCLRGPNRPGMPAYVCIPEAYSPTLAFYQQPAYLGPQYNPVNSGGEPAYRGKILRPEFVLSQGLSVSRVEDRRQLLRQMDGLVQRVEQSEAFRGMDHSYQRAFELVTSPQVKEAFDLGREPLTLRGKYGEHPWGKATLLARRLVEAGVTFVTINHYEADIDWWDDHFTIEKNLRKRLPSFDQALAALIEDLHVRGLGERVLVVACGEFGRSPRIDQQAGRGHWARAMSALLSGGGIKAGQVVGSTTADGGEPRDRPLLPGDLLASIYRVLGIDPGATLPDRQERPVRLVDAGQPIAELF
jgi:Protein of unknown function (DUF1501)